MGKINLLHVIPNHKDATSQYRGIAPLAALQRQYPNLFLNSASEYSWSTMHLNDLIFMQRPYTNSHLEILKMAKDNNLKVWLDYDDDLFTVPPSNPAYRIYGNKDTQKNVATMMAMADVITVSTSELKRTIQKPQVSLNKNVEVIPNAFNKERLPQKLPIKDPRKKLITWRGSTTHQKDLYQFGQELIEITNSHKTWTFNFIGDKPWFLFEAMGDNVIFTDPMDPVLYMKEVAKTQPVGMIVPLENCQFNLSKSSIAWMEAIYFGAVAIGPDWEEWRVPGCLNYKNPTEFKNHLLSVMSGDVDVNKLNQDGWNYILDTLTLTKVNEKRMQIIESLL